MKFTNDRKPSLCIYTNGVIQNSEDKQSESALKKELEATKSALKLQTIRCRQLVAAFTRKLQEKEIELRTSKDLRDQQLSRLLRALLILESRLKKEQKNIREQLAEKDRIIERQEREIFKYKRSEAGRKSTESLTSEPEKWKNLERITGEERLDNLCRNPYRGDEEDRNRKFTDNPVLESVNQILLRDEEELLKTVPPVSINEKGGSPEGSEWYETDSSLIVPEERTETGAWCISVVEEEIEPGKKDWREKSQHLEEKACLEMSKKTLTIAQTHVDLEEIDSDGTKSTASYQEILSVGCNQTYQPVRAVQKPPALPPKPARLLKPQQIHQQNKENQNVKTAEKVKLTQVRSPRQRKKKEVVPNCGAIKIGTSVSSLITGSARDTIVTELSREKPEAVDDSHVSQLVRQFEVLSKPEVASDEGNELRKNFEEFKLEESYVMEDVGRHDGDGAETLNHYAALTIVSTPPPLPKDPPPDMDNRIYETFLETTGLSQKSILTPSRMLSNHRSCLKPKDVKHRNRVKAAAAIEKCGVSSINGPTVKYWTEPFL